MRPGRRRCLPVHGARTNDPLPAFVGRSEQERAMVALTFPDGARREYPNGISGLDIAKGISPSLAKRTVAMALDRSEEHTSELQSRFGISYAVFCLKKKKYV